MALYFEDVFNSTFLTSGVAFKKAISIAGAQAVTAGGALILATGTATSPNIYAGSGLPTVSAPQGSLYMRTDGSSTSTRLYINTNGTTGWTNVTTAT